MQKINLHILLFILVTTLMGCRKFETDNIQDLSTSENNWLQVPINPNSEYGNSLSKLYATTDYLYVTCVSQDTDPAKNLYALNTAEQLVEINFDFNYINFGNGNNFVNKFTGIIKFKDKLLVYGNFVYGDSEEEATYSQILELDPSTNTAKKVSFPGLDGETGAIEKCFVSNDQLYAVLTNNSSKYFKCLTTTSQPNFPPLPYYYAYQPLIKNGIAYYIYSGSDKIYYCEIGSTTWIEVNPNNGYAEAIGEYNGKLVALGNFNNDKKLVYFNTTGILGPVANNDYSIYQIDGNSRIFESNGSLYLWGPMKHYFNDENSSIPDDEACILKLTNGWLTKIDESYNTIDIAFFNNSTFSTTTFYSGFGLFKLKE